jgi:hypothetical protein
LFLLAPGRGIDEPQGSGRILRLPLLLNRAHLLLRLYSSKVIKRNWG